jgi:hypothetical protein
MKRLLLAGTCLTAVVVGATPPGGHSISLDWGANGGLHLEGELSRSIEFKCQDKKKGMTRDELLAEISNVMQKYPCSCVLGNSSAAAMAILGNLGQRVLFVLKTKEATYFVDSLSNRNAMDSQTSSPKVAIQLDTLGKLVIDQQTEIDCATPYRFECDSCYRESKVPVVLLLLKDDGAVAKVKAELEREMDKNKIGSECRFPDFVKQKSAADLFDRCK